MNRLEQQPALLWLVLILGSIGASVAAYWIHILPIEADALPILEAVIDLEGRAPDQYRILPYMLIGLIAQLVSALAGIEQGSLLPYRYAILIFDSAFLVLSIYTLRHFFESAKHPAIWIGLLIIYPLMMFGGYRPIAAFLLLVATLLTATIKKQRDGNEGMVISLFCLIYIMCVSRADLALMYALLTLVLKLPLYAKAIAIALPLLSQYVLGQVVFPEAEYFSPVIMLQDNLSLQYFISSPLTYLWVGLVIYYFSAVMSFIKQSWHEQRILFLVLLAYCLTLFVVGRPNEYRLFLPLLPVVLWLVELNKSTSVDDQALSN